MPNTLVIDGKKYAIPEGKTAADIYGMVKGTSGSSGYNYTQVAPSTSILGSIDPETLSANKDWLHASNELYKMYYGRDFDGDMKDLAEYGLDQMGWFNYNLPRMAIDAARLQKATPQAQKAFLYLMDTYDNLEISWSGVGRFIKGASADPTTYVGLSTLGIGTAASQATKVTSKLGLKSMLKAGITAGVEGGVLTGVSDAARQSVEISAGAQDEFSTGRLLGNTALGFGVGGVLGGALDAGATIIRGQRAAPETTATPPPNLQPTAPSSQAPAAPPVVPEQLSMDLVQPMQTKQPDLFPDAPLEGRLGQPPEGPYAYSGQGELFSRQGLPEQTAPVKPQTAAELKALQSVTSTAQTKEAIQTAKTAAAKQAGGGPQTSLQKALDFVDSLHSQTDGNAVEKIVQTIKDAISPEGFRILPGGRPEISAKVAEAAELLSRLNVKNTEDAKTLLKTVSLSPDQQQGLKAALLDADEKLTEIRKQLTNAKISAKSKSEAAFYDEQIAKIAPAQDAVGKLNVDAGSGSGAELGMRRGYTNVGALRAAFSPEEIQRRNPGMSLEDAAIEWVRNYDDAVAKAQTDDRVKKLAKDIERLHMTGDWASLTRAVAERNALVNDLAAKTAGTERNLFTRASAKFSEAAIGNAFSVSSAVVNTLPSMVKLLYKPTLNAIADNRASIRSIGASYTAMFAQSRAALNAAKAVFNLEINPNFSNKSDFLSNTPEIKGVFGRVIRFFPRFLEATDAFFSRVHYAGFVAAETYNNAAERLIREGVKPGSPKFKTEMNKVMKEMNDGLFSKETDVVEIADTLYEIGTARGYTGKKLEEFVKLEINRNAELFQKATNIAGRDYAVDILFKREFSGDNAASKMAKKYEEVMNAHPLMRVGFQLFVRTPIRVFEEGFRLTPGLNLVSPKFLADLKGTNGPTRQVRAHGEALMSMAFGGAVIGMYANGMITGGGPLDYKQRRSKENDREWQPYTIYLPGGTTISYRNLDPFATPLKLIVNALDRMQMYEYRKAQGEYENDPTGNVAALSGVALMAVLQAVKDANLTDGLNQMVTLLDIFSDPENNENKIANFFNEKAKLLIPNTIGKTTQLLSGEATPMADIATTQQSLSQRINPFDEYVPTQRDILGNKRFMAYNIPSYFGIGVNTAMEKNITKEEQEVLKALADIQTVNGVSFALPYKIDLLGTKDLRTAYIPGTNITMYDRLYDIYKELGVADELYQGLIVNGHLLTDGVADPNKYGTKLKFARETIAKYREMAVLRLMQENNDAFMTAYKRKTDKENALQGAFDVPIIPQ